MTTARKSNFEMNQEAAEARKAQQETAEVHETKSRERESRQGGPLWEVLTEGPTGHRTVHRFRATSEDEAVKAVQDADTEGEYEVVESGPAGHGIGSNDITADEMLDRLKRPE